METVINHSMHSEQPWHTNFNASDQSIEFYFTEDLADADIDNYLQMVNSMVKFMPAKTLLINDTTIKKEPLGLDWKIIEASWESFCGNGGKKMIVIHQTDIPEYMQKTYTKALEEYGIPIELEFKTSQHSTTNKAS